MTRPFADLGRRMNDGGRVDVGAVGHQAQQQLALGHDLVVEIRGRLRPGQRRAPALERHLEPKAIARDDLPAEFGVVDAAQVDARIGRSVFALQQEDGGHLGERLEHEHAGHERIAGKVALKELLVDGHVLERDQPPAHLVLGDGVDEHRRIPVAQAIQRLRYVDEHGPQSIRRFPASNQDVVTPRVTRSAQQFWRTGAHSR